MKIPVASLVGGLIIFIWQFLSWTLLDLHRPRNNTRLNKTVFSLT
jgi:hypothetical protein